MPSWGPELLARTHYALGSGTSTVDTLPDLYERWERWAADVSESHATYLSLVRFRSPKPLSSWVTALLAVLDSAALYLALSPGDAPTVPARLCLRSGFLCFREVATGDGHRDPGRCRIRPTGSACSYEEFLDAVDRMRQVNFPIEREPEQTRGRTSSAGGSTTSRPPTRWPAAVDAVPALWSGPRRHPTEPISPIRPAGETAARGAPQNI